MPLGIEEKEEIHLRKPHIMIAVTLALLLCCVSCKEADKTPSTGILTSKEVAALETCYQMSPEELMAELSLTDENAVYDSGFSQLTLTEGRAIADWTLTPVYSFSSGNDGSGFTGMYMVCYSGYFPCDSDEREAQWESAFETLSQDATALYGEPTVPQYTRYRAIWQAGEQTTFSLSSLLQDDGFLLTLEYKVILPGA